MRENDGGGWIKLHRQFLNWGWYDDPPVKSVFLHLLLKANWTESEYHGHKIKPGQVIIGRKAMSKAIGISEQQIRTAIDKLVSTGEINKEPHNRFTIVTIKNWDKFQAEANAEDGLHKTITENQPQINQVSNHETTTCNNCNSYGAEISNDEINQVSNHKSTNNQPTDNQQITNNQPTDNHTIRNKEYKEIKNIKERKNNSPAQPGNKNDLSLDEKIENIRQKAIERNKEWNKRHGNKT